MSLRLAILGLDPIQRDWLTAVTALADAGVIELVGAGHRTQAAARDVADLLRVPAFDDVRNLVVQTTPNVILMDRPENVSADFLRSCFAENIGILSLGPPVNSLSEATRLVDAIAPRTHLLMTAPSLIGTPGFEHGTHPDMVARPIRFVSGEFHAFNHAAVKSASASAGTQPIVRSMSTLAWDAFSSLIELLGLPEAVYASIRGTLSGSDRFSDVSGAAGLVLRFPDADAGSIVATIAISDRAPSRRALLVVTQTGSARIEDYACEARNAEGQLLDSTRYPVPQPTEAALNTLRTFIEQFSAPTHPHRGWLHRVDQVAACMEAMIVSHRTGQPESPERFRSLRR